MYLIPLQSNKTAFRTAHPGFTVPLYCTSTGRVLLAFCPKEEAKDIIENSDRQKHTPFTITDVDLIMR
ncbi:IclR family transcriptional regulator domain-containing protein [Profundibacter sp.]|uniref:IclR family transcriptional regulator domain-containing protein n=1 Tax=Profundibacter sp. TaxID=3101071 RepID=UPI003D11D09C